MLRLDGCVRGGPVTPWQPGDLLNRHGYLDEFVRMLPGGRALTWNGSYEESDPASLTPVLGEYTSACY